MRTQTRKLVALVPACQALDTRLAPSGNFLAHDFNAVADAVKGVDHHRAAEQHTVDATHHEGLKVHYHHVAK